MNASITQQAISLLMDAVRRDDQAARLITAAASKGGTELRDTCLRQVIHAVANHIDWNEVAAFFAGDASNTRTRKGNT